MQDAKTEIGLFLELDKEFFQKEETSFNYIADSFSFESTIYKKYELIKRYFPSDVKKFIGEEADFSVLKELEGVSLSEPLSIYIETLICKCKGHFCDSLFLQKFKKYSDQCFSEAQTGENFQRQNLQFFLGFEAVFFKEGFNASFEDFLFSLTESLSTWQAFIFSYFFDLFGALSEKNKASFFSSFIKKIDYPKDDFAFMNSATLLIQKIIPTVKDKEPFKYAYAKIVNGLSTSNPHFEAFVMQGPYQTALTYLAEIKSTDFSLIDSITAKKAFANKKVLENMQSHSIPLDPASTAALKNQFDRIEAKFKSSPFPESFFCFLSYLSPFSLKTIEKMISDMKKESVFGQFCQESYLAEDGELLNGRKLKSYEQFSLDAGRPISLLMDAEYINLINCFFRANCNRLDVQTVHPFIENVVSTNHLIQKSDRQEMITIFENLFLNKFGDKFNDLCSQLENSLRFWLAAQGISTKKMKPDSNDEIGISDIFNYGENNRYRDAVEKVIDEDYYFTLTWMLNDDFGWNLRNEAIHGKLTGEKKMRYSVLLASLLIFKLFLANWSSSNDVE
jgi:hypothetical protein